MIGTESQVEERLVTVEKIHKINRARLPFPC